MSSRARTLRRTRPTLLVAAGAFVAICGLGPAGAPAAAATTGDHPPTTAEASAVPHSAVASGTAPAGTPTAETPTVGAGSVTTDADDGADAPSPSLREEYRAAVADYLVEAVAQSWQHDVVAVPPDAVQEWDARQRTMVDPQIRALEDAGWTVRIAVLPHIPYPYELDIDTPDVVGGLQRGLTRLAAEDPHPRTVYLLAQGSSTSFSIYEDGRLQAELDQTYALGPPYVNATTSAPALSYALRAIGADSDEPELLDEETAAVSWTGERYRTSEAAGSQIMTAAFLAGGIAGGVLLILSLLVLLPRRSGPLARIFGTRIDRAHEASALVALRDRAARAHAKLTRSTRLSSSFESSLDRLPDPEESYSPLVWAGWVTLEDESSKRVRKHCFFRPDLHADGEEDAEVLGARLMVPLSDLAAERIGKGRAPSYLSLSGIDRGRPYWTRASSPWAASGYGAFGPLHEAIAAMPAEWRPAPGAARVKRAIESARVAAPSGSAGASPWARTALLAVAAAAALAAGIVGGLHDADQLKKVHMAELGAPGSLVDDPTSASRQAVAEVVAAAADGPVVDPWTGLELIGEDLPAVGDVADEVAEQTGREVRVIGFDPSSTGVVDGSDLADLVAAELPAGSLAVVLSSSNAEIVEGGITMDPMSDRPDRPEHDSDDTVTDRAVAQLRWAAEVSWITDEGDEGLTDTDDAEAREFEPAPDTAEWENRTWVRTLLGAIGAALAVIVAGTFLRGLVVDRTDPTKKTKKKTAEKRNRR